MQTAFWGPARITAIINNSNNSKHLSLVFWVSFCLEMLVRWPRFAPMRFYKQTTLRTAAFTQGSLHAHVLLLYTERFVHREAFTHRRLYTQRLSCKEAFRRRSFYTATLYTKFKDAFAQRSIYAQTRFHTDAFAHRRFHTRKLLHKETFAHNSFYAQMFSSPPPQKTGKHAFELVIFFRFLSRPFQIMNANGWH